MANEKCLSYSGYRQPNHWCERGDSNPHTFRYQILSLARLPIPPLSHFLNRFERILKSSGRISRVLRFLTTRHFWRSSPPMSNCQGGSGYLSVRGLIGETGKCLFWS